MMPPEAIVLGPPPCLVLPFMLYHKAKKLTRSAAELLIATPSSSLNDNVVIAHNDDWYDVRQMTGAELDAFVNELLRREQAQLSSGLAKPH